MDLRNLLSKNLFFGTISGGTLFAARLFALRMFTARMFAARLFALRMFAPRLFAARMFAARMFAPRLFAARMFAARMFAAPLFAPRLFAAQLFAVLLSAVQLLSVQCPTPLLPPSFAAVDSIKCGKACMARGQYQRAVSDFQTAVQRAPKSCEGHLLLGQAYCKLQQYKQGRDQLRLAIRHGHGSSNAQQANVELIKLPQYLVAPKTGPETQKLAAMLNIIKAGNESDGRDASSAFEGSDTLNASKALGGSNTLNASKAHGGSDALNASKAHDGSDALDASRNTDRSNARDGANRPTVIDFYATWCNPCQQLHATLEKAKSEYGDKINFVRIDVDDEKNQKLVDQYEVSPIPTTIYLNSRGEVVGFLIGFPGESSITDQIKKILVES